MNVVIIEDEPLAASKLEKMIRQYDEDIEIVEKLDSVESAVEWLQENTHPDLFFLDIRLSDGTSFDILKTVEINRPVIFTTAYDEYALEAFSMQSIDYLVKPVSYERLEQALDKLKSMRDALSPHHSVKVDAHALERLIEEQRKGYKSRFLVKQGSTLKSVSTGDVAYFYSEDKLVFLKTTQSHKYVLNQSLDELEQMLDPERFFRISRQYIVNFDSIQKVHPHFKGRLKVELVPPASDDVYISSRRASPFKEWMDL